MNKQNLKWLAAALAAAAALSLASCDMTRVSEKFAFAQPPDGREISEEERDELERSGHFLKLTYMPLNTQAANVASAQVANSVSTVAKLAGSDSVRVFSETSTCTVYLPLVYNDNSEFTENGSFYVAFSIHADALTSYVLSLSDKILVPFSDGRGVLDVRTLPVSGPGQGADDPPPDLTEIERDELERSGRYLKLTHMPLNTQAANVASVQIANSVSSVAGINRAESVRVFREASASTVYIPLAYNDNSEFTENGSFYASFAVHVDALTSYILSLSDKILVQFSDGRGELDVRALQVSGPAAADRRYLTIYNLPPYLLRQNVSKVFVHNQTGPVALCEDYSLVEVSSLSGSSTVSIPLSFAGSDGSAFSGTGSFYVSFDLFIDALSHYSVSAADRVLVSFLNGNGFLDIDNLPMASSNYRRCLTISGLPYNLLPHNVSNVMIHNQAGPVAGCENYSLLEISVSDGEASVSIPLYYLNPPGVFSATGDFFVSFDIDIDANTSYSAGVDDRIRVAFVNGAGSLDINELSSASAADHRYLTISGLPDNLLRQNISNVLIHNQSGPVARCENYNLLDVSVSGGKASVRIPLYYLSPPGVFLSTGSFIVAFDINIDANTSYSVDAQDRVQVAFVNGNGSLNINNLPASAAAERRYLTITNLPPNLLPQNVANVMIHNQSGQVARCENYNLLDVSVSGGRASVRIPLLFSNANPPSTFTGTGSFIVAFDINIDADTRYYADVEDRVQVAFVNGNGSFDVNNLPVSAAADHRYLTITNLPSNLLRQNISNVMIYNQAGMVARCENYSLLDVSVSGGKASASIPLSFSANPPSTFTATGSFIVAFDINIDANTRYTVTEEDLVLVPFINGNGLLDIENMPERQIPYLTIQGLPFYTEKHHISNINVYNLNGSVAACDYGDVVLFKTDYSTTAKIPLSSSSTDGYFQDTGRFFITFTVTVDVDIQISVSRSDNVILDFVNGSALFDYDIYGYFAAELANPSDANAPVIKGGSAFDVDGYKHVVPNDLSIPAFAPANSSVIYLYAFRLGRDVYYEFSSTPPSYNPSKKGFYDGQKRALWKMFYLYESNLFLFKTYIENNFPHFEKTPINENAYNSIKNLYQAQHSINGSENPTPKDFTLQPGVYVVGLIGAGGGGGGKISAADYYGNTGGTGGSGGTGGAVFEVFTISSAVSFTAFTGSGGSAGSTSSNSSDTFSVYAYRNGVNETYQSGGQSGGWLTSPNTNGTTIQTVASYSLLAGGAGSGGGGGGSGTFLYSDNAYFLCAGGGGGGSGATYLTPGGGGGAGGAIGPGGNGGRSGTISYNGFSANSGSGGTGGGYVGSGSAIIPYSSISGSSGSQSAYSSSAFNFSSHVDTFSTNSPASNTPYVRFSVPFSSTGGGAGGGVATNSSGLLNTDSAIGAGSSAPSLNTISALGRISYNTTGSSGQVIINFNTPNGNPRFSFLIGNGKNGSSGSNGGNNRTPAKGGGASGGSAQNNGSPGSFAIYKID